MGRPAKQHRLAFTSVRRGRPGRSGQLARRANEIKLPGGTFGANLRAAREAHGWSRKELAARAGLDNSAIYRLEYGQRQPELSSILNLATALRMTGSELLDGI